MRRRMLARLVFWKSVSALAWAQVGYGVFLTLLRRARGNPPTAPGGDPGEPSVAVIVAAYAEQDVIAARVANLLALDPRPVALHARGRAPLPRRRRC